MATDEDEGRKRNKEREREREREREMMRGLAPIRVGRRWQMADVETLDDDDARWQGEEGRDGQGQVCEERKNVYEMKQDRGKK